MILSWSTTQTVWGTSPSYIPARVRSGRTGFCIWVYLAPSGKLSCLAWNLFHFSWWPDRWQLEGWRDFHFFVIFCVSARIPHNSWVNSFGQRTKYSSVWSLWPRLHPRPACWMAVGLTRLLAAIHRALWLVILSSWRVRHPQLFTKLHQ